MREQKIMELVNSTVTAGARPDFADLLRRIEADGGASTAPQMTAARSGAGKAIAYTAAGVAAAAALGTISFMAMSMGGMKSSESFAADMECEAPMSAEDNYGDNAYENNWDASLDASAPAMPAEPTVDEEPVSDSDVSGSDVSDSDEVE